VNTLRLALCLLLVAATAHAQAPRRNTSLGRRIVFQTPGGERAAEAKRRAGGEWEKRMADRRAPGELLVKFAAADVKSGRAFSRRAHARMGATVIREFPTLGWQLVRLPGNYTVEDAIKHYLAQPGVEAAQPNYLYRLAATPNDPRYLSGEQYGLAKIGAPAAWDVSTGSTSVVVAVIDTGIKYTHEDLQANVWTNPGETPGNGIDDDANGYVDDIHGADTRNNDGDPADDHGHGTHVAGTIGAAGNNGLGVAGVNWNVRLMGVKLFDAAGVATTANAVAALQYVTMMRGRGVNVRVSNSSWGGPPEAPDDDPALRAAFRAAGEAGILNVVAAGNSGRDTDAQPFFPASFAVTNLVSVAASDGSDLRAPFSNYGATSVDLAAPGVSILSTVINSGKYGTSSGTSMAAPHVAGAAALLAAHNPALSAASLKATLMNTVDQLPQWSGITVSGGRLNVAAALAAPTACSFALNSSAAAYVAAGGAGRIAVDTSANCEWAAA
jgi:subtilisin family serine protease